MDIKRGEGEEQRKMLSQAGCFLPSPSSISYTIPIATLQFLGRIYEGMWCFCLPSPPSPPKNATCDPLSEMVTGSVAARQNCSKVLQMRESCSENVDTHLFISIYDTTLGGQEIFGEGILLVLVKFFFYTWDFTMNILTWAYILDIIFQP